MALSHVEFAERLTFTYKCMHNIEIHILFIYAVAVEGVKLDMENKTEHEKQSGKEGGE